MLHEALRSQQHNKIVQLHRSTATASDCQVTYKLMLTIKILERKIEIKKIQLM